MTSTRTFASLAIGAALLFTAADASAFCRTTTVRPPPGQEAGCATSGLPLFLSSQCLPYRLLAREPKATAVESTRGPVPNGVLAEHLARAFATWTATNTKCTPGITPIELTASTDTEITGYKIGQRGNNLIGFPDTWKHEGQGEQLVFVTSTFDQTTGEVFDADVEVSPDQAWSVDGTPAPDEIDLQTALLHAVGHMLGLGHSDDPDAIMFPAYTPGTVKTKLTLDDQAGVCAIYPNRAQRLTAAGVVPSTVCSLAPGNANGSCGEPEITHGCSTTGGDANSGLIAGALAAAVVVLRRRIVRRRA